MSPESIPFSDIDISPGEFVDVDLDVVEMGEIEPLSRAPSELGKLSLAEIAEPMLIETQSEPEIQIEQYLKPEKQERQPKYETEKEKSEKKYEPMDGSFLLDREMADAAMGLIYLTTAIPVDEMNK